MKDLVYSTLDIISASLGREWVALKSESILSKCLGLLSLRMVIYLGWISLHRSVGDITADKLLLLTLTVGLGRELNRVAAYERVLATLR